MPLHLLLKLGVTLAFCPSMSLCEAGVLVYIAEACSADLSFEADGGANLVVV